MCYRGGMKESRPILVSGVQPTGEMHLGNYFGAMRPLVELLGAGKHHSFVLVADYHALNFVQDRETMRRLTTELVAAYLAVGLDSQSVTLFKQSDVPAHAELAWIFDTLTTMPYLERAHAYKDAQAKGREVSVGTFNYPMLMAADILLYDAALVPVGQDQKQHIEYARDTAEKFNRTFKTDVFMLPEPYILPETGVVPGIDGRKMSKSYGNTIPLFAAPEELRARVMGIVTDSAGKRPENVYAIHKLVRDARELDELYATHEGNYKQLKEFLAEDLERTLAPLRERYERIKGDPETLEATLARGAEVARAAAAEKMKAVRQAIGVS